MTATNCPIVVMYHSTTLTRPGQRRVVTTAKGGGVRVVAISLTSLTSIGRLTRGLLRQNVSVDLLVGGTKALSPGTVAAISKLTGVARIGCVTPCLLAHGLVPLVDHNDHVIGVMSYACTVNRVSLPSFFAQKHGKDC